MTREQLVEQIEKKKSFLCIGLDTDLEKIPRHLLDTEDPVFEFNKHIIDATQHLAVAYKPNTAFYELYGAKGWKSLQKTLSYIKNNYPDIFTIADAKRGDIGNTAARYAEAFFETMNFDSVTVTPYMGSDSVIPFLQFKAKWAIVLALTSNEGATDFQSLHTEGGLLYEQILKKTSALGTPENMMYVVGATQAGNLKKIRKYIPRHFLLVPGIGMQGGNMETVCRYGMIPDTGLLINSSRDIIYASNDTGFAQAARQKALELQQQMEVLINRNKTAG